MNLSNHSQNFIINITQKDDDGNIVDMDTFIE